MEIINVPINKLKPNEYNPRKLSKREAKELRASLEGFGMVEPIVVNRNDKRKNIIVGGHQRYFLLEKMGKDKVPVVYVDLPLERERELNLRLNKNNGSWDWDLLANFDQRLLEDVGFDAGELEIIKGEFIDLRQPEIDENSLKTEHKCPKCGYEW